MNQILSQKFLLAGATSSLQGGRPENQDDLGFQETPLGFLLIVCDGMGGGPGGKTASAIVKYEFARAICECNPYASRVDSMKMATSRAEEALELAMKHNPKLIGMGSTLVAILINEQSAMIAHLGDSRCYQVRNSKIIFRTTDHSLVSELVQNKALTEEEARISPQSNVITRALGSTENHVPYIEERAYKKGDRFVLCTDGVWGIMPHKELSQRLTAYQDTSTIVEKLSSEIDQIGNAKGGQHDNHTLAIIEMHTDSTLKEKMNTQTKIIVTVLAALLLFSIILNIVNMIKLSSRPQASELNAATEEIERLKSYQSLYTETDKDKKAANQVVYDVIQENDLLRAKIQQANERISSLESKIESLEKNNNANSKAQTNNTKQENKKPAKGVKVISPQEILNNIKGQLFAMRDIKDKEQEKVRKIKMAHRNNILQLLDQFDAKTNKKFINKTSEIRNELKDNGIAMKIDQPNKDGFFPSTHLAKKRIDEIIKQIDTLAKKI